MYRDIFKRIFNLCFKPQDFWRRLLQTDSAETTDADQSEVVLDSQNTLFSLQKESLSEFYSNFLYPMIGLTTLICFLGKLYNDDWDVQLAIKSSIAILMITFAGYFITTFVLEKLYIYHYSEERSEQIRKLVGYVSSTGYVVIMFTSLLPELFFIWFCLFGCIYWLWLGVDIYMQKEDSRYFKIEACALIYMIPYFVQILLYTAMPRLR